jgi:hypothetical protein
MKWTIWQNFAWLLRNLDLAIWQSELGNLEMSKWYSVGIDFVKCKECLTQAEKIGQQTNILIMLWH